jgi:hypothetical protein
VNALVLDHSRDTFYLRHADYFRSDTVYFQDRIDSLLYMYHEIKHIIYASADIPVYSIQTLEQIRRGMCEHRCWYNVQLLRSLGVPSAVDFVPGWGNRNAAHSWNVTIINNESYAFEPYWDLDRWKYKRIYNNRTFDKLCGRFRLPKVFRKTFSIHKDGPVGDKKVTLGNIPPLFRSLTITDVSTEYFDTTHVRLEISNPIPEDTYYAYLSVFDCQKWVPVQWGKIQQQEAVFKGMGRDIVYMPVFYRNYELLYWENGWVSAGKQRGNNSFLCFENVPTNALFLLKNRSLKNINSPERIFIYGNNEVLWI